MNVSVGAFAKTAAVATAGVALYTAAASRSNQPADNMSTGIMGFGAVGFGVLGLLAMAMVDTPASAARAAGLFFGLSCASLMGPAIGAIAGAAMRPGGMAVNGAAEQAAA